MHSLFVDSTSGLIIGLLDPNYRWIEYTNYDEKKPSEIIHFEIFNLIKTHNLSLASMQCFLSSGPGSYTGMRLSEGLAQIFELNQMPVFSFYHFDVPRFCGVKKGFWATNAFKGEVFMYEWDEENVHKKLINKADFKNEEGVPGFTLDVSDPLFQNLTSTTEFIKERAPEIFSNIFKQKLREKPYYFRTLDQEFS